MGKTETDIISKDQKGCKITVTQLEKPKLRTLFHLKSTLDPVVIGLVQITRINLIGRLREIAKIYFLKF